MTLSRFRKRAITTPHRALLFIGKNHIRIVEVILEVAMGHHIRTHIIFLILLPQLTTIQLVIIFLMINGIATVTLIIGVSLMCGSDYLI